MAGRQEARDYQDQPLPLYRQKRSPGKRRLGVLLLVFKGRLWLEDAWKSESVSQSASLSLRKRKKGEVK